MDLNASIARLRARERAAPRPLRIASRLVAGVLIALLLAWAILFITKGRFLKGPFERIASSLLDREVKVAGDFQLYFAPITIRFVAEELTIANPAWATRPHLFTARMIDARIATVPLLFGTRRANRLILDGGRADLEWDAAGQRNTWTFGDPDRPAEPFELPLILRARVTDTELRYRDPRLRLEADIRFDTIRAADTRFVEAVAFTGNVRMRGKPFTLAGQLLSPDETVTGGSNRLVARMRSADARLDVGGTLPGATELDGAKLLTIARGRDLARLFDFIGVAIPSTRTYRIVSNLTKAGDEWRFTKMRGTFGESDLAGRMTISMPNNRVRIDADLASRRVDIIDIGPFIGYDPQTLATKGAVAAAGTGAGRVLPDARLRLEAIQAFDAHLDYKVATIRAPNLPVSNLAMTLDLDRSRLTLSPLTMDLAGGRLASDIVIDARGRVVSTAYDIRLAPTPMGRLLAGFGVDESGTSGVMTARVKLTGEGDTVHDSLATADGRIAVILPQGSLWTRNVQLSELDIGTFVQKMFEDKLKDPVRINCGLIAFTVRQGIAAADPILIDTTKNVVTGRGGFSFRDESLDLAVEADAKKFSLFSGQSPVGIGGRFAAPKIDPISPELLTRAGVGLGLAVAASPLAAVLAFIDPGDAKATACGPVLAGARAAAQRTKEGKSRKDVGKGTMSKG
jgi:uncharacterized protein involved in outer membrane biogenesis